MKLVITLLFICFVTYCAAIEDNIVGDNIQHEVHTDHWAVELAPGVEADKVAADHGFKNLGPVGSLDNVYLFHKLEGKKRTVNVNVEEDFPHISSSPHVEWFEKQVARLRLKRTSITDPAYPNQWHLHSSNNVDVNVNPAWDMGYTGRGVTIGVVDDGLQGDHPDIAHFNAEGSYDYNQGDSDPTPHAHDDHGTSAAGVAGAARNNVCGVGAAFEAGLSGIRLIADYTTDAQEASGLTYRKDINHIYTNSWGPNDDGRRLEGPGSLTQRAMEDAISTGRNGLGSVYVWAGGNGKGQLDNCNYDGYANSRFTITIGAVDYLGRQSYYSEPCSALLACAPSSGSSKSVTTTDLLGTAGTSSSDCTSTFGGTSAAAPLVAGVLALVLEANPRLSWREVQDLIVNTSRVTDSGDGDWFLNGGGHRHNHKYGFGLIDATALVTRAKNYAGLPKYKSLDSGVLSSSKSIADYAAVSEQVTFADDMIVEAVDVFIVATHQSRGDLEIILTSPFGTKSVLQEVHNDRSQNINWRYNTVRSWGESAKGSWTLTVTDKRSGSTGSLTSWQLKVYGH